jgi:hypothetical protein
LLHKLLATDFTQAPVFNHRDIINFATGHSTLRADGELIEGKVSEEEEGSGQINC